MNKKRTFHKVPRSLSTAIFERTLKSAKMAELIKIYNSAKKTSYASNRAVNLGKDLTDFEKQALDFYMNFTDEPMRVLKETTGKPLSQCQSAVQRATKKLVYQNMEKLSHNLK